ncbi:MAG: hypothetical protein M0T86_02605 [Betaproteobacteria bacterium]|nr:hypothetical protein [Betaproteobacteria bacterium]
MHDNTCHQYLYSISKLDYDAASPSWQIRMCAVRTDPHRHTGWTVQNPQGEANRSKSCIRHPLVSAMASDARHEEQ